LSISSIASRSGAVGFMDSGAVGFMDSGAVGFKSDQQKGAAGDPTESRSFGHKIAPEAFSVEATASQMGLALTQRTKELFEAVDLREFLDYGFGAKLSSRETTSRSIEWFNLVSNWVATRIMSAKGLQLRIVVVKRFIALAVILQRLCNFHLLCAVSAGIKSSAVSRLKKTWAGVPQSLQRKLTEIDEFMSPFKNYSKYRDCIVNMIALGQPCLPYLGIYLRDLTFIHEANATFEGTLINQSKFLQVLQVLEDFNHFRDHPIAPDLRQCSAVQLQYVAALSGTCSDPQKLYQISLDLEPRESSLANSDGASSKQVDDEFSLNRLTILDPAMLPRYQLEKAFIALQKHCVELLLQADLPHKL
ncbi:MAG: RasGEF domain-containing protein, partial [archaeon]|nr:RasGEF domain-containing protein [archaeon]